MSTFNSLMSFDDEIENSLHLYLESSQSSEFPQQGRSPISQGFDKFASQKQMKQSICDGFRHNKSNNELKWTTKTAAGTILKFNSEENKEISGAVLTHVRGQYPTVEEGVIRSGVETHFNSVKQKEIMESTGKREDHNRKMVLYGRKHRKLINRRKTLKEKKKIDPKEEERIMKALLIENTSSEDSDSEDDSTFVTRPLSWVSSEFRQLIQRLDRKYDRMLNAQGKRLKSKRTIGEPSIRPCPKKPKGSKWMFA